MEIPQAIRDEIQRTKYSLHGRRKKGRGRGGGRKARKGEGGKGAPALKAYVFA